MANLPFDVTPIERRILSHIQATGAFKRVTFGEPKAMALDPSFTAALYPRVVETHALTLSGSVDAVGFFLRLYVPMLFEPEELRETMLINGYYAVKQSLAADVDLGGLVRNIAFGGDYGSPLNEKLGYADVGGTICRVADITIDCVLDISNIFAYQAV